MANENEKPESRALVEKLTGNTIDKYFYDKSNPDYATNQAALKRVSAALYGNVGANPDTRDWKAINSAADPVKAAEDALKTMYSNKDYMAAAATANLKKGYLPEQSDQTFKQMESRVGSTYDPNWSKGTKFEGKVNTDKFLADINNRGQAAFDAYWAQWGGNPRETGGGTGGGGGGTGGGGTGGGGTGGGGTGGSTGALTGTAGTTVGKVTGTAGTTVGKVTGLATVTPGKVSGTAGLTAGKVGATTGTGSTGITPGTNASSTVQTAPTQLNTPVSTMPVGLITGANTLTSIPGTFSIGNTETGNVNSGGLITGAQQQLFTKNAQAGLPTGVTSKIGVLGNNTGGPSIQPYNPFNFSFNAATAGTGNTQDYYNPSTGQRYTAPPGYTPPSTAWQMYTPGVTVGSGVDLSKAVGSDQTVLG